MSENDNLHHADGKQEVDISEGNTSHLETSEKSEQTHIQEVETNEVSEDLESLTTENSEKSLEENVEDAVISSGQDKTEVDVLEEDSHSLESSPEKVKNQVEEIEDFSSEDAEDAIIPKKRLETEDVIDENVHNVEQAPKKTKTHVEEIEDANAEDAEDADNVDRYALEEKEYHAMSMDQLADELENLLKDKKVQTIKSHVEDIKSEFNAKFSEILEEKKEEFLTEGGNEIDFYFSSPAKKRFTSLFNDYRKSLNVYYKSLESNLKTNLENRLQIIEHIKGLINVEENINTTYKHFKELQEQWRTAGPIPRDKYNTAWNTYHHHVEIFYDFLHLNRDLRDMDFKYNYEQKLKIIERAEELAKDDNTNRSFRELQVLHKMWKEDLGPVDREHREEIWERFSNATKEIHDKRQTYFANIDQVHEGNLGKKEEIIAKINEVVKDDSNAHQSWQKKIKKIEALRLEFFSAGKVPLKSNEATWSKFKSAVRAFNRKKNGFYKDLKKDQYDNLQKKMDLIKVAEDNKDNKDFDTVTPLMKKIQNDWKNIGHVPRKDSDKIWNRFKAACNHYFDQANAERKAENQEQFDAFDKKSKLLDSLKDLNLSGAPEADLETIKGKVEEWKALGHVPQNKRFIEGKFNKALDNLYSGLKMDKSDVEMIKFENKLENLAQPDDSRLLDNEHNFIRKKIDETRAEINQLENNLQFFSNIDETNPLVKNVLNNLQSHKDNLAVWEEKLKKIKELY